MKRSASSRKYWTSGGRWQYGQVEIGFNMKWVGLVWVKVELHEVFVHFKHIKQAILFPK